MPSSSKVIKQVDTVLEKVHLQTRNIDNGCEQEHIDIDLLVRKAKEEAEKILNEAQTQSQNLLNQTQEQIAAIEEKAYQEGYSKGRDVAYQEVKNEAEKIYHSASEVLRQAEEIKKKIYSETEEEILSLTIEIAEKLVYKQLDIAPESIANIVKAACQQKREAARFIIYVHPQYLEILKNKKDEIHRELDTPASIQIVADSNLDAASCRIETDSGIIDAKLSTMLKNLGLTLKDDIL